MSLLKPGGFSVMASDHWRCDGGCAVSIRGVAHPVGLSVVRSSPRDGRPNLTYAFAMMLWAIDIKVGDHVQHRSIPIGDTLVIVMMAIAVTTLGLAIWLRWRRRHSRSVVSGYLGVVGHLDS